MARIRHIDTTLRDGHQCLWATRMSTPMMLPIIDRLDRAGYDVIEVMGSVHFDACVRFLKENPWDRLRMFGRRITRSRRQMIIRSKCALRFELEPDDISRLWVERMIANGVESIIAFDGLHDLDNLDDSRRHAKALGAATQGWLIYSISPVHTDAFYVAKAREFIDRCGVEALMIEDTSGILTPERARTLIPALQREIGEMPLGLHTHNLAGLGQQVYLEAARLGIDNLYSCIAPIADANAPPAIQTTLRNLRHHGFEDSIDDAPIEEMEGYFQALAEHEDKPVGRPQDFDAANFDHQIPGGVMSNLVSQLTDAGLAEKLPEVLVECAVVREELGWPIQVTPFSQFIGVQATLNAVTGERYTRVPDEVKKYALGYYGKLMAPVDPNILDLIVENGSKTIALEPPTPEPALPGLRRQFPEADDELLMLYHGYPNELVDDMRAAPPDRTDYSILVTPFVRLVRALADRPKVRQVAYRKGDVAFTINKRRH